MDLITEHIERKKQLDCLHMELCSNCFLLHTKYAEQKLELIEYKQKANCIELRHNTY